MQAQVGLPFAVNFDPLDDDGQPLDQGSPWPKLTARLLNGTPADLFSLQSMVRDLAGHFIYSFTPTMVGQIRLDFSYLDLDGNTVFFSDSMDVVDLSGGSTNVLTAAFGDLVSKLPDDSVQIIGKLIPDSLIAAPLDSDVELKGEVEDN